VNTGTDDAVAIMVAALRPDLELMACTTGEWQSRA
jgi:inosine-uridine nucleoside N-ribohydrolase